MFSDLATQGCLPVITSRPVVLMQVFGLLCAALSSVLCVSLTKEAAGRDYLLQSGALTMAAAVWCSMAAATAAGGLMKVSHCSWALNTSCALCLILFYAAVLQLALSVAFVAICFRHTPGNMSLCLHSLVPCHLVSNAATPWLTPALEVHSYKMLTPVVKTSSALINCCA